MYTVDLYLRVRLACHVDGLSQREAASRFGIARETVRKMLRHSEPPGYRRRQPPKRPKLAPFNHVTAFNPSTATRYGPDHARLPSSRGTMMEALQGDCS